MITVYFRDDPAMLAPFRGSEPECITSMLRFRLVFARLRDFLRSEIRTVIPLTQKVSQPSKSLSDLTQQLMIHSG